MKTDKYICELLFTTDCVIVPGFGGFITGISAACIHPEYPIIYPPSKSILFNPKLVQNDGLLATAIAEGENISYHEALLIISTSVENYKYKLKTDKKLIIEKVGSIHAGDEGNLMFDQDMSINYLEESFGLNNFVCLPVHTENQTILSNSMPASTIPFVPRLTLQQKFYRVGKVAAIPLFLAIGSLLFYSNLVNDPSISYNSFISVNSAPKTEKNIRVSEAKNVKLNDSRIIKKDTTVIPIEKNNKKPVANTKSDNTAQIATKYYIIGGAFRSVENAEKFAGQLVNKGFHPEIAGKNPAGLTLVSYFNSSDAEEAEQQLRMIQKNENNQAWILLK